MQFKDLKITLLGVFICIFAILIAMFLTQGIPISHTNLRGHLVGNTGRVATTASLLALVNIFQRDVGMFDRPIRDLTQKARYYIFGYNSTGYHFLNALIFSLAIWMIFLFCYRYFCSALIGMFAGLFYIFSPPVWHQLPTLEENSVLTELFVIIAFYLFLRYYLDNIKADRHPKRRFVLNNVAIFVATLLGIKTKGSASIIFPVLLIFILLDNRRRLRNYLGLLIALFVISVPILGIIMKLFGAEGLKSGIVLDPHKIYKLIFVNPDYSPSFGPSLFSTATPFLLILAILGLIVFLFGQKLKKLRLFLPEKDFAIGENERRMFLFVILWALAAALLYIGYPPESEPRYLVSVLVPFSILIAFLIINLYPYFQRRYRKYVGTVIVIFSLVVLCVNIRKIYQLRAAHWSYWIAQENVKHFLEKEEKARNALILGEVELETLSQLNTTNRYIAVMPSRSEMDKAAKEYEDIYLIKHFQPIDSELYRQNFKLIKKETGEGKTYFDTLKKWFSRKLIRFKKPGVGQEYYIHKMIR